MAAVKAAEACQMPASTVRTTVTASKTWVLPPRAKPGRKSKKIVEPQDLDDDDSDKVSSRTKQKASRERKQEYIAELEAKLRLFEHGDGERAALFQKMAKKYSEENDALKLENDKLRAAIAQLQSQLSEVAKSGGADPASASNSRPSTVRKASSDARENAQRVKRPRLRSTSSASSVASMHDAIYLPSNVTIDPIKTDARPSRSPSVVTVPTPHLSWTHAQPVIPGAPAADFSELMVSSTTIAGDAECSLCQKNTTGSCLCEDVGLVKEAFTVKEADATCGLCDPNDSLCECVDEAYCICRDVGIRSPAQSHKISVPDDASADAGILAASSELAASASSGRFRNIGGSVPLRTPRRLAGTGSVVWRLDNWPLRQEKATQSGSSKPTSNSAGAALRRQLIKSGSRLPCSGDPSTCPACADDPAGQAFCSALSSSVCLTNPCANCPNRPSPLANQVARASSPASHVNTDATERTTLRRRDSSTRDEVPDAMIPCSDAWATLRAHPNIGFAALDMLAGVVAKHTHCSGKVAEGDGKIIEVDSKGVKQALDVLDHIRTSGPDERAP